MSTFSLPTHQPTDIWAVFTSCLGRRALPFWKGSALPPPSGLVAACQDSPGGRASGLPLPPEAAEDTSPTCKLGSGQSWGGGAGALGLKSLFLQEREEGTLKTDVTALLSSRKPSQRPSAVATREDPK